MLVSDFKKFSDKTIGKSYTNYEQLFTDIYKTFKNGAKRNPADAKKHGYWINETNGHLECLATNLPLMLWNWYDTSKKVYKIGRDFGKNLFHVRSDFKLKHLNHPFHGIIEFPEGVTFSVAGGHIKNNLVTINSQVITMLIPKYDLIGNLTNDLLYSQLLFSEKGLNKLVSEACIEEKGKAYEEGKEAFDYSIKCLMYILSGKPDLSEYAPLPTDNKKTREAHKEHNRLNGDFPYIKVGFNWKKPIKYHVDGTIVSGHFRWQPCGKRSTNDDGSYSYENVELIWISEHERVFKNRYEKEKNMESTDQNNCSSSEGVALLTDACGCIIRSESGSKDTSV